MPGCCINPSVNDFNDLVNRAISLVQTDSYSKLCTNPLISNMIVTQTELLNISQKESPQGQQKNKAVYSCLQ